MSAKNVRAAAMQAEATKTTGSMAGKTGRESVYQTSVGDVKRASRMSS